MLHPQEVANYFLYLDAQDAAAEGISHLKMQKLLYYAYGFYYAVFREKLFAESLRAWKHGPVVYSLVQHYKNQGKQALTFEEKHFDICAFTEEQQNFLNDIYRQYSQFSAWKLSELSHQEKPWLEGYASGFIKYEDVLAYFDALVADNETQAILHDHPDILERISAIKKRGTQGTPFDEVMTELGIAL